MLDRRSVDIDMIVRPYDSLLKMQLVINQKHL
jgi:hypothetical protein